MTIAIYLCLIYGGAMMTIDLSRNKTNTTVFASFKISTGIISVKTNRAILDTGCTITSIPMGSLLTDMNGLSERTVDRLIYEIKTRYSKNIINLGTSAGIQIEGVVTKSRNNFIGNKKFNDLYVVISLTKRMKHILIGWDFISSFRSFENTLNGASLIDFNRELYDSFDVHNRAIDGSLLYNEVLSLYTGLI